jgi:hypothetical protein
MRRSPLATALVVLTAGVTASAVRRLAARRRAAAAAVAARVPAAPAPAPVPARDAVVLPFTRPAAPAAAAAAPATPARCGDSGGLTRAGAPCAARATSGGRCHHHRVAA